MDKKDREILTLLQADARMTQAAIGRHVALSAASVNERIRRLERDGLLRKWTVLVDGPRAGAEITVFVEVLIESPDFEDEFVTRMQSLDQVQECHFVTGEFTCLVKAKVKDPDALRRLIVDEINSLRGVRQTRSYLALTTFKEDPKVAIPEMEDGRGSRRRKK